MSSSVTFKWVIFNKNQMSHILGFKAVFYKNQRLYILQESIVLYSARLKWVTFNKNQRHCILKDLNESYSYWLQYDALCLFANIQPFTHCKDSHDWFWGLILLFRMFSHGKVCLVKSYLNCSSACTRWDRAALWFLFFIRARPLSCKPMARIRAWSITQNRHWYTTKHKLICILKNSGHELITVTLRWRESPSSRCQGSVVDFLSDQRSLRTGW